MEFVRLFADLQSFLRIVTISGASSSWPIDVWMLLSRGPQQQDSPIFLFLMGFRGLHELEGFYSKFEYSFTLIGYKKKCGNLRDSFWVYWEI